MVVVVVVGVVLGYLLTQLTHSANVSHCQRCLSHQGDKQKKGRGTHTHSYKK